MLPVRCEKSFCSCCWSSACGAVGQGLRSSDMFGGPCTCDEICVEDVHVDIRKDFSGPLTPSETETRTCSLRWHNNEAAEGSQTSLEPSSDGNSDRESSPRDSGSDSCMPDTVTTSRAFDMGQVTLRGVRSDVVLRRRARLLSNASGSVATWALSKPVDHLDAFISHNWCVSRRKKWLALCLHYNLSVAISASVFTAVILALGTAVAVLPTSASEGRAEYGVVYCRVSGFLVFGMVLLFGPDVLPHRCTGHVDVFLDKVCIHQEDKELQREGIEHLGGFLFYSWSLVVLYTRRYTQKVWTVYEMACFLCLHPEGRLVWLPVAFPPLILVGSCFQWLADILVWTSMLTSVRTVVAIPDFVFAIAYLPGMFVMVWMLRKLARNRTESLADLRRFSIKDAVCAVENDRVTVEDNVVSLMRQLKCVPSDCTRDVALVTFDLLVRRMMPRVIVSAAGSTWLRFEHVVALQFGPILSIFDVLAAGIAERSTTQPVAALIIEMITRNLACTPLLTAVGSWLCSQYQELEGAKDIIFVALVSVVCFVVGVLQYAMLRILQTHASDDATMFAVLCLVSAGLLALTHSVIRRQPAKVRRRCTGTAAESVDEMAEALAKAGIQASDSSRKSQPREWISS